MLMPTNMTHLRNNPLLTPDLKVPLRASEKRSTKVLLRLYSIWVHVHSSCIVILAVYWRMYGSIDRTKLLPPYVVGEHCSSQIGTITFIKIIESLYLRHRIATTRVFMTITVIFFSLKIWTNACTKTTVIKSVRTTLGTIHVHVRTDTSWIKPTRNPVGP